MVKAMKTFLTMTMTVILCTSICTSCTPTRHTAANLPGECNRWLADYFRALKAKDISALKELTSLVSVNEISRMGEKQGELMRKDKEEIEQKLFAKTTEMRGDFRDYNIEACKVSQVDDSAAMGSVLDAGQYSNIVCDTMYCTVGSDHPCRSVQKMTVDYQ